MYTEGIGIPEPLEIDGEIYAPGTSIPSVANLKTLIVRSQNIPVLYCHKGEYRLGHTVSIHNDGTSIVAEGLLESPSQWRSEIVESFKTGARWQSSIGSGIIDPTQKTLIRPGETVKVNGQELTGPFILIDHLQLLEISIVPAGADPQTEVLLASINRSHTMTFEEFCASKGFDAATLDEVNLKALQALFNEANPAVGDPAQPQESLEAEGEEKNEEILQAESTPEVPKEAVEACGEEKVQASASPAPRGAARVFPSLNVPRVGITTAAEVPKRSEVLQASALLQLGIPGEWLTSEKGGQYSRRCVDAADHEHDTSMLGIMGEVLKASGTRPDYRNPHAIINAHKELLRASAVSTKDFGSINVFSPIIDKQMRYRYELLDSIWKKLYRKRVVADFKKVATVDITIEGKAKDLLESEDFPNLMFKSTGQEFAVSKQGVTAGISFESQINDDMGALSIVSDELLNIIVDAQTRKFWTYFWAWVGTQFSGSPKNKIAKTLTIAGLSAAKKAFRGMTDSNGRFIQCIPKALLVPLALEDPAEELFKWQWAGQDNTRMNVHHGRYEVIADPFLGADGGMSGATDTNWFMIGDTGRYPLGEFAVLRGFESPKIQEQWYDHKDALNYRALGTIGFTAYTDKLALVYSTGTSS